MHQYFHFNLFELMFDFFVSKLSLLDIYQPTWGGSVEYSVAKLKEYCFIDKSDTSYIG